MISTKEIEAEPAGIDYFAASVDGVARFQKCRFGIC